MECKLKRSNSGRVFQLFNDYVSRRLYWEAMLYPLQMATVMHRRCEALGRVQPRYSAIGILTVTLPLFLAVGIEDTVPQAGDIALQLYRTHGLSRCYKGLISKLCVFIFLNPISDAVWTLIDGKPFPEDEEVDINCMLSYQTLRVVLSHPCHVVMILSITHPRSDKLGLARAILYQTGYGGFFIGMGTRLCGMAIFHCFSAAISCVLCLHKRHSEGVKEAILMLSRDALAHTLAAPLYGLTTMYIARYTIKL